jgi:hypothetical protein
VCAAGLRLRRLGGFWVDKQTCSVISIQKTTQTLVLIMFINWHNTNHASYGRRERKERVVGEEVGGDETELRDSQNR